MSVTGRGARTWWARSITATSALAACVLLASPAAGGAGDDALGRLLDRIAAVASAPLPLAAAAVRARCGTDVVCAARVVAAAFGPRARLEPVAHPDTDAIRWASSVPSVTAAHHRTDGTLVLALDRFGRKAVGEIIGAVERARARGWPLHVVELDLRRNRGGAFARMLRVAALFAGARSGALVLSGPTGTRLLPLPEPGERLVLPALRVLVGPETASSAEILAALLRRHAGARILGRRTRGKDILHRLVPVDHDWRLSLPAERVTVVGEVIAGGLVPDAPTAAEAGP